MKCKILYSVLIYLLLSLYFRITCTVHTSKAFRLKEAVDFLRIFVLVSVFGKSKIVGTASGFRSIILYPHFFATDGCIENWSSVKCLAHNLEVFVATNPSRRRLCTQIRLNFGSFGKRYIATPFCDRMLQLNAAHWGIFKEMQQNFAIYYRYAQYLFTLSGSFWRHTQREISRVYRKSFLGSSTCNALIFLYFFIE